MNARVALKTITHDVASANILAFAREGRLEQHKWHGKGGDGREIACLLGSIHPTINAAEQCPAHLMPQWMARLTVRLFDGVPLARIAEYGEAYALRLHRWSAFDAQAWDRVRRAFIGEVFGGAIKRAEARMGDKPTASWPAVKAVCDKLLPLLLDPATPSSAFWALRAEAYAAREAAWATRREAWSRWIKARQAVAAEAVAEAEAAVAVAEAVAAVVVVAEVAAVVVVAAEVVAAEVAAVVVVAAVVARQGSYAASFDTLLRVIDAELEAVS